jgi:23S rRNA pseudouridine1911/1915/1917 synthase
MGDLNRGHTLHLHADGHSAGRPLLELLLARLEHADVETWRARIARGEVLLDGEATFPEALLRAGQRVSWRKPPWREPDAPLSFALLHEDEHLLGVAKPSGLPTLPGGGFQDHTLLTLVRAHAPGASPMHRLGRGTSGVVLFAKTPAAAQGIQAQWRERGAVRKRYRALIQGHPTADRFVVDQPIGPVPDPLLGSLHSASSGGKPSLSRFEVLERRAGCSLVAVDIETGRPHQIRIHAAAAGHPLLGDPLYGLGGQRAPGSQARPGDLGYTLHAHRLCLRHPCLEVALELEAPAPLLLRPAGSQP